MPPLEGAGLPKTLTYHQYNHILLSKKKNSATETLVIATLQSDGGSHRLQFFSHFSFHMSSGSVRFYLYIPVLLLHFHFQQTTGKYNIFPPGLCTCTYSHIQNEPRETRKQLSLHYCDSLYQIIEKEKSDTLLDSFVIVSKLYIPDKGKVTSLKVKVSSSAAFILHPHRVITLFSCVFFPAVDICLPPLSLLINHKPDVDTSDQILLSHSKYKYHIIRNKWVCFLFFHKEINVSSS